MELRRSLDWEDGYETGLEEAIRLVDGMRGPGDSALTTPVLLRIRAELIALRETAARRAA